ncbi:MAG: hypothetical protein H0X27_08625 [Caulobacteraceae bacterium]|nr:hypothetical protein [Caulobacteraceae bacterium]
MSLTVRDVIKRALRMTGALAAGDDPNADDAADALIAFNSMKRAMFGTFIGPRMSPIGATLTFAQAENGGEYQIAAGAGFVLVAPLNPRSGSRFGIVDAGLGFGHNVCIINRNGRLLEGLAANLPLTTAGDNRRWWFRGDTGNWVREADYLTPDDAIEFPDNLIAYLPYMLSVALAAEFDAELRPDIVAGAEEGREAFARLYARRGRNGLDMPIGVGGAQAQQQQVG